MKILSLFDGISCGQVALGRSGIKYEKYFSSEIDPIAISITQKHFPKTIQLGDIEKWQTWNLPAIDIMIGGFPCTSLSVAARQKESGLIKGESVLFWKLLEVFRHYKPKYFLFENVASMKKTDRDIISKEIGCEPIKINSNLVSAQNRNRLYWTNIEGVEQPEDRGILLKDIIENGFTEKNKSYCITATYSRACEQDYIDFKQRQLIFENKEACALSYGRSEEGKKQRREFKKKHGYDGGPRSNYYREWTPLKTGKTRALTTRTDLIFDGKGIRKLTPIECERLQTLPDGYTSGPAKTNRYKLLGNGFTVDVIVHILKNLWRIKWVD